MYEFWLDLYEFGREKVDNERYRFRGEWFEYYEETEDDR